jgi:hypothetical protein
MACSSWGSSKRGAVIGGVSWFGCRWTLSSSLSSGMTCEGRAPWTVLVRFAFRNPTGVTEAGVVFSWSDILRISVSGLGAYGCSLTCLGCDGSLFPCSENGRLWRRFKERRSVTVCWGRGGGCRVRPSLYAWSFRSPQGRRSNISFVMATSGRWLEITRRFSYDWQCRTLPSDVVGCVSGCPLVFSRRFSDPLPLFWWLVISAPVFWGSRDWVVLLGCVFSRLLVFGSLYGHLYGHRLSYILFSVDIGDFVTVVCLSLFVARGGWGLTLTVVGIVLWGGSLGACSGMALSMSVPT